MRSPGVPLIRARFPRAAAMTIAAMIAAASSATCLSGCIGSRYAEKPPAPVLDQPTQAVVARVNAARAAAQLPEASWVAELAPPAVRAAMSVARGDQPLRAATRAAALGGVTELGRHSWSFGTDCTDPRLFNPPHMVTQQKGLLFAAAAVPGPAGRHTVILLLAEPGATALRAEQMGGGNGGTNPTLETYMHPSVASGPCGEGWPAGRRAL